MRDVRYNLPAFTAVVFAAEHDYARCALERVKGPTAPKATLERTEYEEVLAPATIGYERRFLRCAAEYLRAFNEPGMWLNVLEGALAGYADFGFGMRRLGADLVVDRVWGSGCARLGERVVRVNGIEVDAYAREARRGLCDITGASEHEVWDEVLSLAERVDIEGPDGVVRRIAADARAARRGQPAGVPCASGVMWTSDDLCVMRVGQTGSDAFEFEVDQTIAAIEQARRDCRAVVLDLRQASADALSCLPLVPLVVAADTPLGSLPGYGPVYLNCSINNAHMVGGLLDGARTSVEELLGDDGLAQEDREALELEREQLEQTRVAIARAASGSVLKVDLTGDGMTRVAPRCAGVPVFVLTDIYTRDGGELLARIARDHKRALVVGRSTMGTTDCALPLTIGLDASYSFTYPAALTPEAYAGERINGRGVAPAVLVPWDRKHLASNVDLEVVRGML